LRGILLDSLRANLGRRFQSDVVQALIAAWAMHLDYAPDISGGRSVDWGVFSWEKGR
jgi:hypothetical protein